MNPNLTNSRRECSSRFYEKNLILIIILSFTVSSSQIFAQGSTCATAQSVWVNFNALTSSANGPNSGNGAVNSCFASGNANHASWYTYTSSFNGHIKVSSCYGGVDTRLSIFTGNCNELVCVASNDDSCPMASGSSSYASNIDNISVTIGTTYYIQWDNRWSSNGFDWILWEYPATPSNNSFCTPTVLNCGSSILGTTYGTTASGESSSCAFSFDNDVYYKINAFAGVQYTVTLYGSNFDGVMSAHYISSQYGSCDWNTQLTEFACVDQTSAGGAETITFTRPTNQVVLIRAAESYYTGQSGFSVALSCSAPVNDKCANAINIPINGPPISGNNTGATVSNNIPIECGNAGDNATDADVWFKFLAPSNGKVTIETFNEGNFLPLTDSQIQVFSSCGGEALYCDEDGGSGFMSKIVIPCDELIKNAEYYIQVDGWRSRRGAFKISVTTSPCPAPINDDCANAITLLVNQAGSCLVNQTLGTTSGATSSAPNACEPGSPDVYYKFNPGGRTKVIINLDNIAASDLVLSVFKASCSSEAVFCHIDLNQSIQISVTPFTTYYVRVHSLGFSSSGTFNICIEKLPPQIAAIYGSVNGWNSICAARNVNVSLFNTSTFTTYTAATMLSAAGIFVINPVDIPVGTYHILVKVQGALAVISEDVVLNVGSNTLNIGSVVLGDVNDDNAIDFVDVSVFSMAFGASSSSANYVTLADLNCDGVIDFIDVSIFSSAFGQVGDNLPSP